jgi:hypothetical protein
MARNPLLDSREYVDLFIEHSALDGATRRARGALRMIARDLPDVAHAATHDGPVTELVEQLEHRLGYVIAALDMVLARDDTSA